MANSCLFNPCREGPQGNAPDADYSDRAAHSKTPRAGGVDCVTFGHVEPFAARDRHLSKGHHAHHLTNR